MKPHIFINLNIRIFSVFFECTTINDCKLAQIVYEFSGFFLIR
ncbi:hypothetical protein MXB_3544 [Myxobolus squamalis]|nr:hypothetical protein MXB_3544 [Myxobolus squamalis]